MSPRKWEALQSLGRGHGASKEARGFRCRGGRRAQRAYLDAVRDVERPAPISRHTKGARRPLSIALRSRQLLAERLREPVDALGDGFVERGCAVAAEDVEGMVAIEDDEFLVTLML